MILWHSFVIVQRFVEQPQRSWRARLEVVIERTNDRWDGWLNDTDAFSGMHTTNSSVSAVFKLRISRLPHTHGGRPEVSPTVTSTAGSDRERRRREQGEHANIQLICLPCITMHSQWIEIQSSLPRFDFAVVQHGGHSKGFFELHTTSRKHSVVVTDMMKALLLERPWSLWEFMSVTSVHIVAIGHRLFFMGRKNWSALKNSFVSVFQCPPAPILNWNSANVLESRV